MRDLCLVVGGTFTLFVLRRPSQLGLGRWRLGRRRIRAGGRRRHSSLALAYTSPCIAELCAAGRCCSHPSIHPPVNPSTSLTTGLLALSPRFRLARRTERRDCAGCRASKRVRRSHGAPARTHSSVALTSSPCSLCYLSTVDPCPHPLSSSENGPMLCSGGLVACLQRPPLGAQFANYVLGCTRQTQDRHLDFCHGI